MLALTVVMLLSVVLAFALGAGAAFLVLKRKRRGWPMTACDSSGRTGMDYLFEIIEASREASPQELALIRDLSRRCMQHSEDLYQPPRNYPADGHCECLSKALHGAEVGNWRLVIDELSHDG